MTAIVQVLAGPYTLPNGAVFQTGDTAALSDADFAAIPGGDLGVDVAHYLSPSDFTPRFLPGLHAWYDASQIIGLNDGDEVTQWNDLSGNNLHLTRGPSAAGPVYKPNVQNGKAVTRWPGSGVLLQTAAFTALSQPWTVFGVWRASQGSTVSERLMGTSGNGSVDTSGGSYVLNGGTPGNVLAAVGQKVNLLVQTTARLNGTAGLSDMRINGIQGNSANTAATGTATRWVVGASSITSLGLNGDIAELIIYDRLLSDAECQTVERYLL